MEKEVTAYDAPPMSSLVSQGSLVRQKTRGAPPPLPITLIKTEESLQTLRDILNPPQSPPSSWGDSSLFTMPAVQDMDQTDDQTSTSIHNIPPTAVVVRKNDVIEDMSLHTLLRQTSQRSGGSINSSLCPPSRRGRNTQEIPVLLKPLVRDDNVKTLNPSEQNTSLHAMSNDSMEPAVRPFVQSQERQVEKISSSENLNLHFNRASSLIYSRQSLPLLESMKQTQHKMHGTDRGELELIVDDVLGESPDISDLRSMYGDDVSQLNEAAELVRQSNIDHVVEGKRESEVEQRANEELQLLHDQSVYAWEQEPLRQQSLHNLLETQKRLPKGYALLRMEKNDEGVAVDGSKMKDDVYAMLRSKWTALVHGKTAKQQKVFNLDENGELKEEEEEEGEDSLSDTVPALPMPLQQPQPVLPSLIEQNVKSSVSSLAEHGRTGLVSQKSKKPASRTESSKSHTLNPSVPVVEPSRTVITANIPAEELTRLDAPSFTARGKLGLLAAKTLEHQLRKYKPVEEANLAVIRPQSTGSGSRASSAQQHQVYSGNQYARQARKDRGKSSLTVTPVDLVHSTAKGVGKRGKPNLTSLQAKGESYSQTKQSTPLGSAGSSEPSRIASRLCVRVQQVASESPYIWTCVGNRISIKRATDEQIGSFDVEDTITSILSVRGGSHPAARAVLAQHGSKTHKQKWTDYEEDQMLLDTHQAVVWVGTASGTVLLIDPLQLLVIARLVVHKSEVTALTGSDSFVASADSSGTVVLWRIDGLYCMTVGTLPAKVNDLQWTLPPYPLYGVQEGRRKQAQFWLSKNSASNNNVSTIDNNAHDQSTSRLSLKPIVQSHFNTDKNAILDALSSIEKKAVEFIQRSHDIHQAAFYDAVHTPSQLYVSCANGVVYVVDCFAAEEYALQKQDNIADDDTTTTVPTDVAQDEMKRVDQTIQDLSDRAAVLPVLAANAAATTTGANNSPSLSIPTSLTSSRNVKSPLNRSPTSNRSPLSSPRTVTLVEPVIIPAEPLVPALSQYNTSIKVQSCIKVTNYEITKSLLVGGSVWVATSNNHLVTMTIGPNPIIVHVQSVSSAIIDLLLVGTQVWVITGTNEVVILDSINMAILGRLNRKGPITSAVIGEVVTTHKVYLGSGGAGSEVWSMTERIDPDYISRLEADILGYREWCRGILKQGKGRFEILHKNTELEYLADLFQQDIDELTGALVMLEQKAEHGLSRINDATAATKHWTIRALAAEGLSVNQQTEQTSQKQLVTLQSNMVNNLTKQMRRDRSFFELKISEQHNNNNKLRVLTKEAVMGNAAETSKNLKLQTEVDKMTEKLSEQNLRLELLDQAEQWESNCRAEAESSSIAARGTVAELNSICKQLLQQENAAQNARVRAEAAEALAVEQRKTAQHEQETHLTHALQMKTRLEGQVLLLQTELDTVKKAASAAEAMQADELHRITAENDRLYAQNELLQKRYKLYKTDTQDIQVLSAKLARTLANVRQRIDSVRNVCVMSNHIVIEKELSRISLDIAKQVTQTNPTDRLVSGM